MAYLAGVLFVQAVVAASPSSYAAALTRAEKEQKPLVVLVGAEWCPGCRTMKHSVLPALAQRGGLKDVAFAIVDTDVEANLARQLMRGNSIPQLIVFTRAGAGQWRREQIVGATSEAAVRSLLERATVAQRASEASSSAATAAGDE